MLNIQSAEVLRGTKLTEYEHRSGCARAHHTVVYYRKSIYAYGGVEGEVAGSHQVLWRYNIERSKWGCVGDGLSKKYGKREGHSAVVWKSKMVVYGGHRGVGFCNDTQAFDFESMKWGRIAFSKSSVLVSPRFGHAATVVGDVMWVAGGFLKDDSPSVLVSLSLQWMSWCHHPTPPYLRPNANTQPTMAHHEGALYLIGLHQEPHRSLDVCVYNIKSEVWTEILHGGVPRPDILHPPGGLYASSVYHVKTEKIFVFGTSGRRQNSFGMDFTVAPVVLCFHIANQKWKQVRVDGYRLPRIVPPTAFDVKFSAVSVGDKILLHGGVGGDYLFGSFTPCVELHRQPKPPQTLNFKRKSHKFGDEEPFTVSFSKEVHPPSTAHLHSTTPVVRLTSAEEVRQWQETAYASQKRWLLGQYTGGRAEDARKKELNKANNHKQGGDEKQDLVVKRLGVTKRERQCLEEVEVTAESCDKDVLGVKLGGGVLVARGSVMGKQRSGVGGDVKEKKKVLWTGLKRIVTSAVLFKGRVFSHSPRSHSPLSPQPAAAAVSPLLNVRNRESSPMASIEPFMDLLTIGTPPPPPTGPELRLAIKASSMSPDPHVTSRN